MTVTVASAPGTTPVLDAVDRYAAGMLTYRQLRDWIAMHTPPEDVPMTPEDASRYRVLCGCDAPVPADVARQLCEAEVAGLLTEQEAADLYDAWCNP